MPAVEEDTDAVEDASGREQDERSQRDRGDQVIDRHEDRPAERKVRSKRPRLEPLWVKELEHHASRGHRPDEDQQAGAPGTADRDARKRRVGTGNHHEDRGVIEPTPERPARTIACEVVEGRAT
jgi:hypothetical protein